MKDKPPQMPTPGKAAFVGAIIAGVSFALFSHDYACNAISAAILGAVVAVVITWISCRLPIPNVVRWIMLSLSLLVVSAALTLSFRASLYRESVRTAFGNDVRSQFGRLDVRCSYMGGPGDSVTLMMIEAAPGVIDQLVSFLPVSDEENPIMEYRRGEVRWDRFWDSTFNLARSAGWARWQDAPVMTDPDCYRSFTRGVGEPSLLRVIVWDRKTGTAYVMLSGG